MTVRLVIGVVGGGQVPEPVLADAEWIGSQIAGKDAVLLTGGKGKSGAATVKDRAALGALAASGRLVSMLPGGTPPLRVERDGCQLVAHSGMRDARNVLNAYAADALIALRGGVGTLTEVAFAAVAGRPVIFWDSRVHLEQELDRMGEIASQAVAVFGPHFTEAKLKTAVAQLREDSTHDALSREAAVAWALARSITRRLGDLPTRPAGIEALEAAVAELAEEP